MTKPKFSIGQKVKVVDNALGQTFIVDDYDELDNIYYTAPAKYGTRLGYRESDLEAITEEESMSEVKDLDEGAALLNILEEFDTYWYWRKHGAKSTDGALIKPFVTDLLMWLRIRQSTEEPTLLTHIEIEERLGYPIKIVEEE